MRVNVRIMYKAKEVLASAHDSTSERQPAKEVKATDSIEFQPKNLRRDEEHPKLKIKCESGGDYLRLYRCLQTVWMTGQSVRDRCCRAFRHRPLETEILEVDRCHRQPEIQRRAYSMVPSSRLS